MHPARTTRHDRSICFVPSDRGSLSRSDLARFTGFRDRGWAVHVLLVGDQHTPQIRAALEAAGVNVHLLDPSRSPVDYHVPDLYEPSATIRSDHVRHALEQLHREFGFGVIEFDVHGGLGFRAVQAKRAGLAFAEVVLSARLGTTSRAEREQSRRWPAGLGELEIDFAERFSFEEADTQATGDSTQIEFARRAGWTIKDAAEPVPNSYESLPAKSGTHGAGCQPLVTIGIAHFNLGKYLPETLESIAGQTYPNLEVIVIDDGSTDPGSRAVVATMRERYPQYRILAQPNAGIGATRNRCLAEARGEYFIPVDADNVARPEMVARFVAAIDRNPGQSAMTCYFLAFGGDGRPEDGNRLFAVRPAGGPHTMASIRNVYGDANAIFRAEDFRSVGGYETDRGTSCEDWEAFVKLVHAGKRIGVVPEHLFDYRHRPGGFSRVTNWFNNHQRVLRQFAQTDTLPPGEAAVLWSALLGFQQQIEQLTIRQNCRRYRVADRLHAWYTRAAAPLRRLVRATRRS